ncbi:hypothetical protein [Salmonirosea aquatica]|uniref:Lipocalin-like domain-containing protein n=1 Tax=Salmonirosea aquatica TaxID=2654236 RepID=A0A7C9BDD4_9BACT|nr:hypothetical protein [Cytophagaceae bacterium SJW1-29]
MKKQSRTYTRLLTAIVGLFLVGMFSCQKKEAEPSTRELLVGKWWCDYTSTMTDQYFDSDGTFKQRYKGVEYLGKWELSANNEKLNFPVLEGKPNSDYYYEIGEIKQNKLQFTVRGDSRSIHTLLPCSTISGR